MAAILRFSHGSLAPVGRAFRRGSRRADSRRGISNSRVSDPIGQEGQHLGRDGGWLRCRGDQFGRSAIIAARRVCTASCHGSKSSLASAERTLPTRPLLSSPMVANRNASKGERAFSCGRVISAPDFYDRCNGRIMIDPHEAERSCDHRTISKLASGSETTGLCAPGRRPPGLRVQVRARIAPICSFRINDERGMTCRLFGYRNTYTREWHRIAIEVSTSD